MAWFTKGVSNGVILGFALASMSGSVEAAEVIVQNDNLVAGQQVGLCPCFVPGEEAAAWLTSPCNGTIVGVQILWKSLLGGQPPSLEEEIRLYEGGTFPFPGAIMTNQGPPPQPAILSGPAMQDGGLNEFRFLDESGTVPLNVPVVAGQVFVVSLKFANQNNNNPFAPRVAWDCNNSSGSCAGQCQAQRNAIYSFTDGGWINGCTHGMNGDWIIRAIVNCGTVNGRCCLANGTCIETTSTNCTSQGGTYGGDGSTCSGFTCPQPMGACCVNSVCSQQTQANCVAQGGTFLGAGTACNSNSCKGACCVASTQSCVNFTQVQCNGAGGVFHGIGTNCSTFVCFPVGACCLPSGSCLGSTTPENCAAQGGTFMGNATNCGSVFCPEATGRCCVNNSCIERVTLADCNSIAGTWGGPNTDCSGANPCANNPCPADIAPAPNGDGTVSVNDLLAVINAWGNCPAPPATCDADVAPQPSGDSTVNVSDLLYIINNWGPCQ